MTSFDLSVFWVPMLEPETENKENPSVDTDVPKSERPNTSDTTNEWTLVTKKQKRPILGNNAQMQAKLTLK